MKKVEKKGKGLHAARRDVFFALRAMVVQATDNEEVASPAAAAMARRERSVEAY